MNTEDRIFELEKALESVLDLFEDDINGTWITVSTDQGDGYAETNAKLPTFAEDTVSEAIRVLYYTEMEDGE